jgi:uncharacterized spore protein YtfJ
MADNTKFGSSMQQMFEGMDKALGTKTVMGEAVDLGGGKFVIPLADVSFGMGAGASINEKFSSNGGGGGVNAKMTPHAVLLIENGSARIINVQEENKTIHFLESVPDLVNRFASFLKKEPKTETESEAAFDDMEV